MELLVQLIVLFAVSVSEMDWAPAVSVVAEEVPVPSDSVVSARRVAAPSVLVKWTVPAYVGSVLPNWSWAVTVKLNAMPAVADDGVLNAKCVAEAAATEMTLL